MSTVEIRSVSRWYGNVLGLNRVELDIGTGVIGKADLMDDRRNHVHGVVYDVPEESLDRLDVYESVERGRYRRQEVVVQTGQGEFSCAVYRGARFRAGLKPSKDYLARLVRGAEHHHLPEHYLTFLRSHGTIDT